MPKINPFVYHENPSGDESFMRVGDAWAVDEEYGIAAVADSPLRTKRRKSGRYPFNDQGFEAADIFCREFISLVRKQVITGSFSTDDLQNIFMKINENIREFNLSIGNTYDDPLEYDVAETVGVGTVVFDGKLYYGGLEDCYVNVLRGSDHEEVQTFDYQIMKAAKYARALEKDGNLESVIPRDIAEKIGQDLFFEWIWAEYLKNNPDAKGDDGALVGWGCFSGALSVDPFLQVHELDLEDGDDILLFSDHMIPALEDSDFLNWFLRNKAETFGFQGEMRKKIMDVLEGDGVDKEKTLIYFRYEK